MLITYNSLQSILLLTLSNNCQISVLMPICEELDEEEARSHCERNINSYWTYLAPALYGDNINTEAVYERICGLDQG